jgi:hypothetical protein
MTSAAARTTLSALRTSHASIALSTAPQDVEARVTLSTPIPAGSQVRLAADSLRSVMSGFKAERIGVAGGDLWQITGGVVPRPQPKTGVDRAPRQLLLARCPGAAAGETVAVGGPFYPEGSGKGPTLAPNAGVPITFRLEVAPEGADSAPDTSWSPASDWFGFVLHPADPDHLEAVVRPDGSVGVRLFDRYLNPLDVDPGPLMIEPAGLVAAGARVTVRDAEGRQAVSAPAPLRSAEGEQLLFGEFHWHTEASGDGARPIADSYRSARDGLLLDYAGAADHFPFEPPPSRYPSGLSLRNCMALVDTFDAPGSFVTLFGVELSWRMGHYNFYWTDKEELERFITAWESRRLGPLAGTVHAPDIATFYGLAQTYFEQAREERLLVIPHHTNATSANLFTPNGMPMWSQYHWPLGHYDPRVFRLAEMLQGRGCFESEEVDPAWKVRSGAGGGSLRTALARGFRVGFTGGTDNHTGWPGRQTGGWVGLTAVYADEFSRAGIMRGLYRRRCYATTGVRIGVDFRLNGAPMGSELLLGPSEPRRFGVRVHGTAPLERAEIVSHGVTIAHLPVEADSPDLVAEWADERPGRPVHDVYYYLRVRQADGHCAWASPIWVDLALPEDGGFSFGGPVAWS